VIVVSRLESDLKRVNNWSQNGRYDDSVGDGPKAIHHAIMHNRCTTTKTTTQGDRESSQRCTALYLIHFHAFISRVINIEIHLS
jgi:hypothetical protein